MRVLVCGGRAFADRAAAEDALDRLHAATPITLLIEGDARGADRMAGDWARSRGIGHAVFPADWARLGRKVGPIRNQLMLDEGRPELVVAFPGGRGTRDMTDRAERAAIPVLRPLGDGR